MTTRDETGLRPIPSCAEGWEAGAHGSLMRYNHTDTAKSISLLLGALIKFCQLLQRHRPQIGIADS